MAWTGASSTAPVDSGVDNSRETQHAASHGAPQAGSGCYRPPPGALRLWLELEWDGRAFLGWQSQPGGRSVQDTLHAAFAPLVEAARPVAAGRTDAGVHALKMPVHVDVGAGLRLPPERLVAALNARLPPDLAVLSARPAPPGFHARFSCLERAYLYRLLLSPTRRPLWEGRALWVTGQLDLAAMQEAAAQLIGVHDFAAFATREERQTVRELREVRLEPVPQGLDLHLRGESFLRHMVRGLVGTLLEVGRGKLSPADIGDILASRQRSRAGANVPAHGLYFAGARYPEAAPADR